MTRPPAKFQRGARAGNRGAPPERWRQERQMRKDEREGPQWIYGFHAVTAALANPNRKWERLVATRNAGRGLEANQPEILEPRAIDKLLPPDAVHQGLAMLAEPLVPPPLAELLAARVPLIFLDHVTDPHNVGAILRSCAAFGFGAVVTTVRHAPSVTGVLAKAASGALEHVPYLQVQNLADALTLAGEASYVRLGLDERGEPIESALDKRRRNFRWRSFSAPRARVCASVRKRPPTDWSASRQPARSARSTYRTPPPLRSTSSPLGGKRGDTQKGRRERRPFRIEFAGA